MTRERVAVVTGASAGVGRAVARVMGARGFDVGLIARGTDGLDATVADLERMGRRAFALPVDVANAVELDLAADRAEEELGPIDVWINDAMTSVFGRFTTMSADDFRRVTEVTYLGYVYGTAAALRRMVPRDRGVVIQVGSALAYRGIPLQSAYCGAKHAIQGFTESVRTELMHDGSNVRLTMVQLPAMNTPQFDWVKSLLPRRAQPVAPIYQPEVAAEAIAWAAEHPRREMWVGGTTVATLLATKVAPGLLDRYLSRTGLGAQQTDEPEDPDRPHNLYGPVDGDHGAHGRFDDRAMAMSPQVWASTHRWALTAVTGAVGLGVALTSTARRNGRGTD